MANLKDSFTKGLATINVKTSNFMEENKLKTYITTLESEIERLKLEVGEAVYEGWKQDTFSLNSVEEQLNSIKAKNATITEVQKQIESLAQTEKEILGADHTENTARMFCPQCGAENKAGYRFCEKCGTKLES
jgi:F0F1-type ATP synthase alpha subunit